MTPDALSPTSDLPPRTWRGWWLAWPKWFRIGCWAALTMVVMHVLLAIWCAYCLVENEGIADLRRRGVTVDYFWEHRLFRFQYDDTVYAAIFGRSWWSVVEIELDNRSTEADVLLIASRARSLEKLSLGNANISAEAIGRLANCRCLRELNLRYTDADDAAVMKLLGCGELTSLYLTGTLVSDAAVPVLKQLPRLAWVDVQFTEISAEAVQNWRTERSDLKPVIATERDQYPSPVLASFCWSDGVRSSNFSGPFELLVEGPLDSNKMRATRKTGANLDRRLLWWRNAKFNTRGDGRYQFTLTLNGHLSDPATVDVHAGTPSPDRIEFRMPCTKAEALATVKNAQE